MPIFAKISLQEPGSRKWGRAVMGEVRVIAVKSRLRQLLYAPGGVSREEALGAATQNVEMLRDDFIAAIPVEIAALEAILNTAGRTHLNSDELDTMLRRAGQILTLSGTFGFDLLDRVVKRFCDLAMGMKDKNIDKTAPVAVHLRAMRLVCPGGPQLSDREAGHMLQSLEQVHAHLGIKHLDGTPPAV